MNKSMRQNTNGDELHSDGWGRFERAVDAAVKSGPKHRAKASGVKPGVSYVRSACDVAPSPVSQTAASPARR